MMDKFIVEIFINGEMLNDEVVESNQRLFNEQDLDAITANRQHSLKRLLFVRSGIDVNNGYFIADDGRWDYGTREDALNVIKRRV